MPTGKGADRERWLKAVGRAIREHRMGAGLSQEELGYRAGLHRTYVSDVERGRRNPTVMTLESLSVTLAIRPSEILAAAEEVLGARYLGERSRPLRVAERPRSES